mgnify:CR=1 FL=1
MSESDNAIEEIGTKEVWDAKEICISLDTDHESDASLTARILGGESFSITFEYADIYLDPYDSGGCQVSNIPIEVAIKLRYFLNYAVTKNG